jgi:hypothetical protein
MQRYHARYVFLTREELEFWRPNWQGPDGLPLWLTLVADLGGAYVYQREGGP